jgi:hypothetical protein
MFLIDHLFCGFPIPLSLALILLMPSLFIVDSIWSGQ